MQTTFCMNFACHSFSAVVARVSSRKSNHKQYPAQDFQRLATHQATHICRGKMGFLCIQFLQSSNTTRLVWNKPACLHSNSAPPPSRDSQSSQHLEICSPTRYNFLTRKVLCTVGLSPAFTVIFPSVISLHSTQQVYRNTCRDQSSR